MRQFAPIRRRRTPTFPRRMAYYFDCSQWNGGFVRVSRGPGAVVLDDAKGLMLNLCNGEVYKDTRFEAANEALSRAA